jgi:2-amino-4-hydroxy-6-hydroxymethyldihydropteridine diphosphokinase
MSNPFAPEAHKTIRIGKKMPKLLALGANLPFQGHSPQETILSAIDRLEQNGVTEVARSRFYLTPCFPVGAGPDFVNAVVSVRFGGTAQELIALCHQAEAEFGRTRNARWSARTLDVDLLCWDETIQPDHETAKSWIDAPPEVLHNRAPDQLILPHPRIQDRAFVLVPMADVAPNWRHPILGQTVVDMLARLPQAEIQAIYAI